MNTFKGVLHLKPKMSMFCALSQKYQPLFEKWYMHLIVIDYKELINGTKI